MSNLIETDFIDFVTSLFPLISPYTKEQVRVSLEQFYSSGKTFECFNDYDLEGLNQGDILENVPFFKVLSDGQIGTYIGKGIILSNSCDIENDEYILFAPFFSVDDISFNESRKHDLYSNRLYGFLYFPDYREDKEYVDLSKIISLPKNRILKNLAENKIVKRHSLTLIAYYLLICKLTIHFLRPEDEALQNTRKNMDFKIPKC